MKKGLKIAGIIIGILLILMLSLPFLFKGKIKEAVISTANRSLNAELQMRDFGLNLFSNFPNATLSLKDVSISGIGKFSGDTLVKAKSANATINLMSLFGNNYDISKIELDNASVYAKLLADGTANWDIVKGESEKTETEASPFHLSLKKISINDCNVIYEDQASNMKVILQNWNGDLSGNFADSETTLQTQSTIDEVSFIMDRIPYLSKVKGKANATIKADLDKFEFSFIESEITLNEVKANIDGTFAMVGEDGMNFDLKLKAPDTQFKDILSIMPEMYTSDFSSIKTSGTASLQAYIKGLLDEKNYPAFNFKMKVSDAMFQYPSLPKSVNNINVDILIDSKGGTSLDNTVIDLSKLSFNLGGNPFSASINVQTPISDPNIKARINGTIDLGMIKEVYPLEKGTELNGKLTANLDLATKMSYIEKEQYNNVTASGSLVANNMIYRSSDMQDVTISKAGLQFNPQYVELTSLDLLIGKNDISANGRLDNFMAYVLSDKMLKGKLNIKSNYLNVNDFMGDEASSENKSDSIAVGTFIVPSNVDFILNANMNKVVYDKINITNLTGSIIVRNSTISMQDVSAKALGGSCKVNGAYSTAESKTKPKVNFSLDLNNASFTETFKSVEAIQKFAPIFEKVSGNYSMNFKFNTSLGESIMQILGALTGEGVLKTDEVKIEGLDVLDKLSSSLKMKGTSLKSFSTRDLNIPFKIENGKIITKPFNVNIGNDGKLNLEGTTGLDESINYKGTVTLPKSIAQSYVNNVGITISGTFTNPKIGIDTKSLFSSAANAASSQLLGGSIDEKKEEVNQKLSEEKIKQAQKIRNEAKAASDKLISESQIQSQKLVDEAKNPLAKIAAQKAADKIVSEAKKQGQRLIDEAEVQAKKLEAEQ